MFSTGCGLKFYKRANEFANSTKSCRVTMQPRVGWSYDEKIFYFDSTLNKWIFNTYNFSATTSKHQRILRRFLGYNFAAKNDIITISAVSINNFDWYLKEGRLNSIAAELVKTDSNINFIEAIGGNVESFRAEIDEAEKIEKEHQAQLRLVKNVTNVNYKTAAGFIKACEELNRRVNISFLRLLDSIIATDILPYLLEQNKVNITSRVYVHKRVLDVYLKIKDLGLPHEYQDMLENDYKRINNEYVDDLNRLDSTSQLFNE